MHVVSRPAGTRLAHSFRAGDDGPRVPRLRAAQQRRHHYYPDSGKVALVGGRRDRSHRAARLLGRRGPAGLRTSATNLDCGHEYRGRCARRCAVAAGGDDPCARPRRGPIAARAAPRARAAGRDGGAGRRGCAGRRPHRGCARHARAARRSTPRSTPGRPSPRSWLAGLPFALAGWRAARRAGLSRQRLPGWFGDQAKSLAIGAVVAPFVTWRSRGRAARLAARLVVPVTAGSIALELLLTVVTPVLIVPLFLRSHPLPPGPLADDLFALAGARRREGRFAARARGERQDVGLQRVRGGHGPTRRIMLFDNLLGEDPEAEGRSPRRARCSRTSSGITPAVTSGG